MTYDARYEEMMKGSYEGVIIITSLNSFYLLKLSVGEN